VNFLDDDDLLLPSKIERQINVFHETDDVGVVMCHVRYERPEHDDIVKNIPHQGLYNDLLKRYAVASTGAHLIRRDVFEAIGGFDESLVANQEYDLHIRLSKQTTYAGVDEALTVNRQAPDQISYDFPTKQEGLKQLWDKYKTTYQIEGVYGYNYCRFTYLHAKYIVGRYLGRTLYTWLP
jgi:hypothetical protein